MKRIALMLLSLFLPILAFAQTPDVNTAVNGGLLQDQKSVAKHCFEDIKEGVTSEKDVLAWFGEPRSITNKSGSNTKVLKYTPLSFNVDINILTGLVISKEPIKSESQEQYPGIKLKPVIYLYPTHEQEVNVRLEYQGNIFVSYPQYNEDLKGWSVTAYPDGRIINPIDKTEYSYLFWEGFPQKPVSYDLSKGFVVKGEDAREFLKDKLIKLGLTPKEYNEFIVYWYPKMMKNKYNLVYFSGEDYESHARLTITPKPDSILRVFMVLKPLEREIAIQPQEIRPFVRTGFTVVEWGGTELVDNQGIDE